MAINTQWLQPRLRLTWKVVRSFTPTIVFLLTFCGGTALAQTNCPEAHPDGSDAYQALQNCLNGGGTVILTANVTPGYFVSQTLQIVWPGTMLTSTAGCCAAIVAAPSLMGRILENPNKDDVTIRYIWFDGNNTARVNTASQCQTLGSGIGVNVRIFGNNFTFDNTGSINAVCGSGLEIQGTNLTITNSFFASNGSELGSTPYNAVSDGLTVWACLGGGTITNNDFSNNTDVDLIVGGGTCNVYNNRITHYGRYGIAGLMSGDFGGAGDHTGMSMSGNTVDANPDLLSYGIMVGEHPWNFRNLSSNAGSINSNTSRGAVVNLAIDGVAAGDIQVNTMSAAGGSRTYPASCGLAADYTAAHFGSSTYQGGSVCRYYDPDAVCQTFIDPDPPCPAAR